MGMSPNHPLPKFRLISVPLVRCKPPKGLPIFPPDMQSSEHFNRQSQPQQHYPLQQPEKQQLWYVLDKEVEKQLNAKHCHSSFPNLVPWSCLLHPNSAWSKAGKTDYGPNLNTDTLPQLERKLNRLYERKQQLTDQLLEEERNLQSLLREEMCITGANPDISSHTAHQCIQNGAQISLSDLSAPSTDEENQLAHPNCIMGKFRWKTARRSKSAHERPSESSQSFRKSTFRYTELTDESPNFAGLTPLDPPPQLPLEKRPEIPVLRKHHKWWRLNRRQSTVEESMRRPSAEAVSANPSLRSRGSSMPPCDQRSATVYNNTSRGRSNRSSMKLPRFVVPDWCDKVVLGNAGKFFASHNQFPDHWIIMRNSNQVMLMNNEKQSGCRGHLLFQPTAQCSSHKLTGPSTSSGQIYTNVDRRPPPNKTDEALLTVVNTVTGNVSAPMLSKSDENNRKHKMVNRLFHPQPEQWTTIRCEPGMQRCSMKVRHSPPPVPPKGAANHVGSHLAAPVYFHPVLKYDQDLRHARTTTTSSDSGVKYRSHELQG
ncbi:hypothetical protein EG68_04453, partial [Paragonimus skrjabini miyazakii]